jgi:methionyl-tRNA synthetase
VWLDAPIGYITNTKVWAEKNGKNWEDYWKNDETELVHFIGKDNIVFHCIIFPIILKSHGGFNLPVNVPANEFMNLEGDKISTSRNWAVWLHEYLEDFPNRQDEMRYVLASIMPEQKDSEFTWNDFKDRVNNELADIFGNFVNRTLVLTHKYYAGEVPSCGELSENDRELLSELKRIPERISELIYAYKFREAQAEAMNLARLGNKYLADQEPWKFIKTYSERVKTILNLSLQITANLSIVFQPFLPKTAAKLQEILGVNYSSWNFAGSHELLKESSRINNPVILFAKIEDEMVQNEIDKLKNQNEKIIDFPKQKELVLFEDFSKMDIRLGKILSAEKVEKADKLLQLTVDTGIDIRTVVSGIAEHYNPSEIIGKTVAILLNLAPRKIRGIESQGMILMAENEEGELSFMIPEKLFGSGGEIR